MLFTDYLSRYAKSGTTVVKYFFTMPSNNQNFIMVKKKIVWLFIKQFWNCLGVQSLSGAFSCISWYSWANFTSIFPITINLVVTLQIDRKNSLVLLHQFFPRICLRAKYRHLERFLNTEIDEDVLKENWDFFF